MKDKIQKIISETIGVYHGANSQFAKKIGARPGLVGDWLSGRSSPKNFYREKICNELNVSREWLDTGTGEMLIKKPTPETSLTISERELGKLEGKIEMLTAQVQRYEQRLDKYDRDISKYLEKCIEWTFVSDPKMLEAAKVDSHPEGQPRRATANTEQEEPLISSGRRHR